MDCNLLARGDQLFSWLQLEWRKIPDDLIDQLDRIVAHALILYILWNILSRYSNSLLITTYIIIEESFSVNLKVLLLSEYW